MDVGGALQQTARPELAAALDDAYRRLERERTRYFELFELAPVGYVVTDRHGAMREVNRTVTDLLAALREDLRGKPLADFVPRADRQEFQRRLIDLATNGGEHSWQSTLTARDGRNVVVELTVIPSRPDSSERDELLWVIQDLTERVETEAIRGFAAELEARVLARTAELEAQRARLQAVVDTMPVGLVIVDLDHRVQMASERALEILGGENAVSDRGWEGYTMKGRRYEPGEFPLERTVRTGEVVSSERIELVTAEGSHVVVDVSTAPIDDSAGTTVGALCLFHDVTTQERHERAEREFVTNAAHELQSPLAAIVSAIEVLQAGAKDGPQRDVFLGHIERAADRLARLVRALLVLARTQIGLEPPRDELLALCPLLEGIGAAVQLSPGVELEVDCPEDLAVLTNRELVEQAVMNLAENAAKHTTTGRVVLSARDPGDGVVELAVSDTGFGIAASERPRVFDRFYRAGANGTTGFGLGLAIVRAVADALEGELELDSTVGGGTIVRLRIPHAASLVGL